MYKKSAISTLLFALVVAQPALAFKSGSGVTVLNGALSTSSNSTDFLTNGGSLSCSSSTGKLIVDTTGGTLAWCNASTVYQSALGDDNGKALSGDDASYFFSSGILEPSVGGTGNKFTEFSGPSISVKTFTLPNSSSTLQVALSGGDVTTTSGGASASIGDEKVTESKLDAETAPTDEYCLTYESTSGRFQWQECSSTTGVTGVYGVITTVSESLVSSGGATIYMSPSGSVSQTDSLAVRTVVPAGTWKNLRCTLSQSTATGATTVKVATGSCVDSNLTQSSIVTTSMTTAGNVYSDITNSVTTNGSQCMNFVLVKTGTLATSAWLSCTIERIANS